VHSVVFGGFAAKELATRIEDAKPKLIFSASCGLEPGRIVQYKPLLDEAIRLSSVKPQACIIVQRPQQACELVAGRDHDWRACAPAPSLRKNPPTACRCSPPTRFTFSTPRARREYPRAWCATMAGIWSR